MLSSMLVTGQITTSVGKLEITGIQEMPTADSIAVIDNSKTVGYMKFSTFVSLLNLAAGDNVANKDEVLDLATYDTDNDGIVDFAEAAASVQWNNVLNKPTFASVAFSGNYLDLTNLPDLSSVGGANTILSGTGAPSSGLGNDGDFFIDTFNVDLYGPKTNGSWGSAISLKGTTGATGATGQGVPTGGTTGQVLTKTTNSNYATAWQSVSSTNLTYNNSTSQLAATTIQAAIDELDGTLDNAIQSDIAGLTGAAPITNIVQISQANFDALSAQEKADNRFYIDDGNDLPINAASTQTLSLSGTDLSISGGNTVDLSGLGGGGSGNTNLTYNTATRLLESDTGTDVTLPLSTASIAGLMSSTQFSKLAAIENNATADQTASEIKTLYESNANTNAFTDALQTKLNGIETGATADLTGAEIKSLYEAQANTNAYTDADLTKLAGIETGATADQTAAEVSFNNAGSSFAATTVQAALLELESDISGIAGGTNFISSDPAGITGGLVVDNILAISQADYDALSLADQQANVYLITDGPGSGGVGGATTASELSYDNTGSTLEATTAQAAIDELDATVITSIPTGLTGATAIDNFVKISQNDYNSLTAQQKADNLYMITDTFTVLGTLPTAAQVSYTPSTFVTSTNTQAAVTELGNILGTLQGEFTSGNFTPTIEVGVGGEVYNYTAQEGKWQRFGDLVHYEIGIDVQSVTGTVNANTNFAILGIPFPTNDANGWTPASISHIEGFIFGSPVYEMNAGVNELTDKIEFTIRTSTTNWELKEYLKSANLTGSSKLIYVQGWYLASPQ